MTENEQPFDDLHPEADIEDEIPASKEQLSSLVDEVNRLTRGVPREEGVGEECYLKIIPLGSEEVLELRRWTDGSIKGDDFPRASISLVSGPAGQRYAMDVTLAEREGELKVDVNRLGLDVRSAEEKPVFSAEDLDPSHIKNYFMENPKLLFRTVRKIVEPLIEEQNAGLSSLSHKQANELIKLLEGIKPEQLDSRHEVNKEEIEEQALPDQIRKLYSFVEDRLKPLEGKLDQFYRLEDDKRFAKIGVSTLFRGGNGPNDPKGNQYEFEIELFEMGENSDYAGEIYYLTSEFIEKERGGSHVVNETGLSEIEAEGGGLKDLFQKENELKAKALENWEQERSAGLHSVTTEEATKLLEALEGGIEVNPAELIGEE